MFFKISVTLITDLVGSEITKLILQTSGATNFKGIDDYQTFELMDATVGSVNRPTTLDIRDQLQDILSTTFNFHEKVVANVERLQAKLTGLDTYIITVHGDTITLVILSNIKDTSKHKCGSEFRTAMHTIR